MKRIYLFMALLVSWGWLAEPCQAQTIDEIIRQKYERLNKAEVQSNILIHQTPLFLWPGNYDGTNVADTMQLSLDKFGMLYGQFRGAAVGASVLPDPSRYVNLALQPYRTGDTIGLAFMTMQFDHFRAEATDSALVEWIDGQLHDVPGRPYSPYIQDTCIAFVPLQQYPSGQPRLFPSYLVA